MQKVRDQHRSYPVPNSASNDLRNQVMPRRNPAAAAFSRYATRFPSPTHKSPPPDCAAHRYAINSVARAYETLIALGDRVA